MQQPDFSPAATQEGRLPPWEMAKVAAYVEVIKHMGEEMGEEPHKVLGMGIPPREFTWLEPARASHVGACTRARGAKHAALQSGGCVGKSRGGGRAPTVATARPGGGRGSAITGTGTGTGIVQLN